MVWDSLGEEAWMYDELTLAEFVFDQLVDMQAVIARADELGVVLSAGDLENSRLEADWFRDSFTFEGNDQIRQMGFSRSSFYRFMEMWTLYHAIRIHIGSRIEVTDEEIAEAYEEFLEENLEEFTTRYVHLVAVEEEEFALELWRQLIHGADIVNLINDYNVVSLFVDEDNNIVSADITRTSAGSAHMAAVLEMSEGDYSEVGPLAGGNYGFFKLERIVVDIPEELEGQFAEQFDANMRNVHFREYADLWIAQSTVTQNDRFFRGLNSSPMLDIDWDDFDWDDLGL